MAALLESLRKSSINIQSISQTLSETKKSTSAVNNSVDNISRIVATNTRVKRELFARSDILNSRREEASKRRELEDQIESTRVSTSPQLGLSFSSRSEKSPLGRLLGFLGFITAGWIIENLPTWIFMGQEFISRINSFGRSMYRMIYNMQNIIKFFGDTLKYSFDAIIRLDFDEFAGEGTVARSFEELNLAVQDLGTNITDTFKLFTTPLTESLKTGEKAPGLGETRPDTMFPPTSETNQDLYTLATIASLESSSQQGRADVAQSVYNRMKQRGQSATQVVTAPGQYSPFFVAPEEAKKIKTYDDAVNYLVKYKGYTRKTAENMIQSTISAISNPQLQAEASKFVGPRTSFRGSPQNYMPLPNVIFRGSPSDNQFLNEEVVKGGPAAVPSFRVSQTTTSSIKGGKIIEYLTGDRKHKRYRADHAAGNYHDHVAFSSKETRDAAIKWLRGKGWVVGSINTGRHAEGSYHYSNQAFDIPFYPNQSKKGVSDDAKGETALSSRLRADLISGGFNGPQLSETATKPQVQSLPAQISAQPKLQQPAAMTLERKGSEMLFIDATQPQVPQVSYPSQQPTVTPTITEFKLLNNFIKNKLLLDLAYL